MAERTERETAKIYQFPAGGRAGRAAGSKRTEELAAASRHPRVDYGSWYHEAAIEAERPANH
jgi:hypothetical protein